MRVFVTGGTGTVGRYAVPRMMADGHAITMVVHERGAGTAAGQANVRTISLNLLDRDAVVRAVAEHDAVVHLATRIPRGNVRPFLPGAWAETDTLRRDVSRILVDAALANGVQQCVLESFALAYPDSGSNWVTEDIPLRPAPHARTVCDSEASAARFSGDGRHGVSLRFALLYGPNDDATLQLLAGARHGVFAMLGDPDGYLPVLHHADAGAAVAAALRIPSGAYNVVDNEPLTRREFAATLGAVLDVRPPRLLPAWVGKLGGSVGNTMSRSIRLSNAKLRAAARWQPEFPTAAAGLRDVLQSG